MGRPVGSKNAVKTTSCPNLKVNLAPTELLFSIEKGKMGGTWNTLVIKVENGVPVAAKRGAEQLPQHAISLLNSYIGDYVTEFSEDPSRYFDELEVF